MMLWLIAASMWAQTAEEKTLDAARAAMASANFCFLITVDAAGQPQARLMEPLAPEPSMTVWLGTNPATRKMAQIRRNPRATLAYYDVKGPNYVTLIGSARIVDDLAEKRKRWRAGWETFYPGGVEGKNFTLIEFTPATIELISTTANIANKPASLLPAILRKTAAGWKLQ